MIAIIAITLITIAVINILSLRRRQARLHIFSKVTPKNTSLTTLLESQLQKDKQNFFATLFLSCKQTVQTQYDILLLGYSKTKLFGYLLVSIIVGMVFNRYYIGMNVYKTIIISLIVAIFMIIYVKKRALKKQFYDTFPEALATIIGAVSSGYAITTSFKTCGDTIDGMVGKTMKEINSRMEVGENLNNILMSSYRRLPFPEYYFFILTIMVNLDSGGELKEILSRLAKMLANNRILAKTRDSKTSELRMTVFILAAIPFGFILLLKMVSPIHYNYLFETASGNYILYYVVGSVTIGVVFIRSMINKVV
ncbi:tight adherence protein B [Orbus hercynius]|uniref:Tight adherence protein B n=1 Tax=Orbus hercynius TaxID=593135 RepID=A0A495RKN1_9GAMM|nr:type II secretion system F family protein [Orbus hercynius]RKS87864.1 tight adherence protein B [Orbus hercynius]